jgi:hypothetical protein
LKRQLEGAQRQLHDLEGTRKVYREQLEEEERERRKILENELKALEVDLMRAKLEKKDAMDAYQAILEQSKRGEELNKEFKLLSDTLKVNYHTTQ